MKYQLKNIKATLQYGDYYKRDWQNLSNILKQYKQEGKVLAIWGAGLKGISFLDILDSSAESITYVVDVAEKLQGTKINTGHTIVSPQIFDREKIDVVFVINEAFYIDTFLYLQKKGFSGTVLDTDRIIKNSQQNANQESEESKLFGYTMEEIQQQVLTILEEVDRVCRECKISYVLEAGSALGARRYGGFIPCDDDIDIAMLREDYERFLKIAPKRLRTGYLLQTSKNSSDYPYPYAQVVKDNTCFVRTQFAELSMHHGIHIDLAPLDYVPEDTTIRTKQIKDARAWTARLRKKKIPELYKSNNLLKKIIVNYEYYLWKFVPKWFIINRVNEAFLRYYQVKSDRIGDLCTHYKKDISFPKEWIFPPESAEFMGKQYPVPRCMNEYLSVVYDDYQTLSPRENGITKYNLTEVSLEHNYHKERNNANKTKG